MNALEGVEVQLSNIELKARLQNVVGNKSSVSKHRWLLANVRQVHHNLVFEQPALHIQY